MTRLNRESNPIPGEKPGYLPQYIGDDNNPVTVTPSTPYPTKDKELELVKAELQAIKNQLNGTLNTQLTGSSLEQRGLSANKPSATEVEVGTTYWSVDTDPQGDAIEISNGTNWVVL